MSGRFKFLPATGMLLFVCVVVWAAAGPAGGDVSNRGYSALTVRTQTPAPKNLTTPGAGYDPSASSYTHKPLSDRTTTEPPENGPQGIVTLKGGSPATQAPLKVSPAARVDPAVVLAGIDSCVNEANEKTYLGLGEDRSTYIYLCEIDNIGADNLRAYCKDQGGEFRDTGRRWRCD